MLGQGGCVVGGGADREEMEGEETGSRTGRCVVLKDEKQWGVFLWHSAARTHCTLQLLSYAGNTLPLLLLLQNPVQFL